MLPAAAYYPAFVANLCIRCCRDKSDSNNKDKGQGGHGDRSGDDADDEKNASDFEVVVEAADEVADVKEGEAKDHSRHHSKHSLGTSARSGAGTPAATGSGRTGHNASGRGGGDTGNDDAPPDDGDGGSAAHDATNGGGSEEPPGAGDGEAAAQEAAETTVYAAHSSASSEYDNPNVRDHDESEGEEECAEEDDDDADDAGESGDKACEQHTGGWDRHMTLSVEGMVRDELKWLKKDGYLAGHVTFHQVRFFRDDAATFRCTRSVSVPRNVAPRHALCTALHYAQLRCATQQAFESQLRVDWLAPQRCAACSQAIALCATCRACRPRWCWSHFPWTRRTRRSCCPCLRSSASAATSAPC